MAEIVINNFFIQNNIVNCSESEKKEEKKNDVFVNRALEETLKLPSHVLRNIWNTFIDESSLYGEDSYVYDSEDYDDLEDLHENIMSEMEFNRIFKAVKIKRYFQYVWTSQNHNTINIVDPKDLITRYWGDVITSIINFPYCYKVFYPASDKKNPFFYYEEVVVPIVCERIGVECLCNK